MNAPARGVRGFARDVWLALTWRKAATAVLLGVALQLLTTLEAASFADAVDAPPLFQLSGLIIVTLIAFSVLAAILIAEQAIARGARAWLAYPIGLLVAAVIAGCVQQPLRLMFGLFTYGDRPEYPLDERRTQMAYVGLDTLIFGTIVTILYLDQCTRERNLRQVRAAELARTHHEQQLVQSRLAAARAMVDPAALLTELADLKQMYEQQAPHADAALDDLIHRLRAKLAPGEMEQSQE